MQEKKEYKYHISPSSGIIHTYNIETSIGLKVYKTNRERIAVFKCMKWYGRYKYTNGDKRNLALGLMTVLKNNRGEKEERKEYDV